MANWFIALPVDAGELPPDLLEGLPAGLRRFHPADLHITLAFLGSVTPEAASAAWRAAGIDAGPFTAALGTPAALGKPRRPSAFGLDLGDGGEAVAQVIGQWRDPLRQAAGLAAETRAPRPHLTLGRPPRRGGDAIRARARHWVETYSPPATPITLDRIALYTWAADRRERQFRIVDTAALPCAPTGDADGAGGAYSSGERTLAAGSGRRNASM